MTFPATFKEFAEQYKIVDKEEVYTNGVELIPIFRVEQWLDNANVAREIFDEIEKLYMEELEGCEVIISRFEFAELKKKYLGEDINAPTKESEGEK